jgi:hypothetical protein
LVDDGARADDALAVARELWIAYGGTRDATDAAAQQRAARAPIVRSDGTIERVGAELATAARTARAGQHDGAEVRRKLDGAMRGMRTRGGARACGACGTNVEADGESVEAAACAATTGGDAASVMENVGTAAARGAAGCGTHSGADEMDAVWVQMRASTIGEALCFDAAVRAEEANERGT